jgi:hypothetical protein
MLMERQRSPQAKEATVFRNTPRLGRDRISPGQSPTASSPPARELPEVKKSGVAMALHPEAIQRRAYEIYIERGGRDGHDVED